jgi:hypothetical protein
MTERQAAVVECCRQKQSLRLVAREFNSKKPTIHSVIKRFAPEIMRRPGITYKWERPQHRNRKKREAG